MSPRQLNLIQETFSASHGGDLSVGKAKKARPISTKVPIHLVMRSDFARGAWAFNHPRHVGKVECLLQKLSKKWGVRIYEKAVGGNHAHFLVQAGNRICFQNFLREFLGSVARVITQSKKGQPLPSRFFKLVCFSRLVTWGRDFKRAKNYVIKNALEFAGLIAYQPRCYKKVGPPI